MGKKVLIISSSLRKNSNSEKLAEAFGKGARESGNETELVTLAGKEIGFCRGCLACQKTQSCVIKDDAPEIVKKMLTADVLVFTTPIYYYEMSGQMKTMLDRANPLFPSDYAFRDVYLLTAAAEDDEHTADGATKGVEGWVACFGKARLAGTVFAGGATDAGDIEGHPALGKAESMGRAV